MDEEKNAREEIEEELKEEVEVKKSHKVIRFIMMFVGMWIVIMCILYVAVSHLWPIPEGVVEQCDIDCQELNFDYGGIHKDMLGQIYCACRESQKFDANYLVDS